MYTLFFVAFFAFTINASANSVCPKTAAKFKSILAEKQCQYGIAVNQTASLGKIDVICHIGSNWICDWTSMEEFVGACKKEAPKLLKTMASTTCRYIDLNNMKVCPVSAAQHKVFEEYGTMLDLAEYRNEGVHFHIRTTRSISACEKVVSQNVIDDIANSCAKFYNAKTDYERTGITTCRTSPGTVLFKMKYPAPNKPTNMPTNAPTTQTTDKPSDKPSNQPSNNPSMMPTNTPSTQTTDNPSDKPSNQPSNNPSMKPTDTPTTQTTDKPSDKPSNQPSNNPSMKPTNDPSTETTDKPSNRLTDKPENGSALRTPFNLYLLFSFAFSLSIFM